MPSLSPKYTVINETDLSDGNHKHSYLINSYEHFYNIAGLCSLHAHFITASLFPVSFLHCHCVLKACARQVYVLCSIVQYVSNVQILMEVSHHFQIKLSGFNS